MLYGTNIILDFYGNVGECWGDKTPNPSFTLLKIPQN